MAENSYESVKMLLASAKPEELRRGLELARQEIARVGSGKARPLLEMVSAIFYIDPLDRLPCKLANSRPAKYGFNDNDTAHKDADIDADHGNNW